MAGRPRKPTNLLAITGALARNPKRYEKRKGEPKPDGALGPSPARWAPHPLAIQAATLFADGVSTNDAAAALGVAWEAARDLRDGKLAGANAQLSELWEEVRVMAPWLTNADGWTVESICELKLKERMGVIKPGERAELGRLCGKCGLNPSDRTRVNTSPKAPSVSERADPRDAFMKRKARTG